ncbi:MAG: 27 kDa unknown protein [Plant associated closterovirus 1]|nr:MAG: 27 kDa unknown protein [Plant associated closterovirus 1]
MTDYIYFYQAYHHESDFASDFSFRVECRLTSRRPPGLHRFMIWYDLPDDMLFEICFELKPDNSVEVSSLSRPHGHVGDQLVNGTTVATFDSSSVASGLVFDLSFECRPPNLSHVTISRRSNRGRQTLLSFERRNTLSFGLETVLSRGGEFKGSAFDMSVRETAGTFAFAASESTKTLTVNDDGSFFESISILSQSPEALSSPREEHANSRLDRDYCASRESLLCLCTVLVILGVTIYMLLKG